MRPFPSRRQIVLLLGIVIPTIVLISLYTISRRQEAHLRKLHRIRGIGIAPLRRFGSSFREERLRVGLYAEGRYEDKFPEDASRKLVLNKCEIRSMFATLERAGGVSELGIFRADVVDWPDGALRQLPHLRYLELIDVHLDRSLATDIGNSSSLKELGLYDVKVADDVFPLICNSESIEIIAINCVSQSGRTREKWLSHLRTLPSLRQLAVSRLSPSEAKLVSRIPTLRVLFIGNQVIPRNDIMRFNRLAPQVEVVGEPYDHPAPPPGDPFQRDDPFE